MTPTNFSQDQRAGTKQDDFDIRVNANATVATAVLWNRMVLRNEFIQNLYRYGRGNYRMELPQKCLFKKKKKIEYIFQFFFSRSNFFMYFFFFFFRNLEMFSWQRFCVVDTSDSHSTAYHYTYVVVPFDTVMLLSFATAVQYFAFEVHIVTRFYSTRIECAAQAQFHDWRIWKKKKNGK